MSQKVTVTTPDGAVLELPAGSRIEVSADGTKQTREADIEWEEIEGWKALPDAMRSYLRLSGGFVRSAAVEQSVVSAGLPEGFERQRDDSFVFLASEPVPGRDGYILAGPWDLSEYELNPVVLWGHNYISWNDVPRDHLPVGRALQVVEPVEGYLYAEIVFDEDDEMGALIARKYRNGFLNAVSVRWVPKQIVAANQLPEDSPYYVDDDDLYVMFGCRLIEISAVPLGGLATAIQVRHTDTRPSAKGTPTVLDTPQGDNTPSPQGWWDNLTQEA